MHEFSYFHPASLDEAKKILAGAEEGYCLAGGMSLLPTMKLRLSSPKSLVNISTLPELSGIRLSGDALVIGAATTHYQVLSSEVVDGHIPALSSLAKGIADVQVRYRGTIGGSVANADPAADYPAAMLGLGCTIVTDRREIHADDFFLGLFETALQPGEIIVQFRIPIPRRAIYLKMANMASRFAIVGVFVAECQDGARVAVTGAASCAFRARQFEKLLNRQWDAGALDDVDVPEDELLSDHHASAQYRAHLIRLMTQRAVSQLEIPA